MTRFQKFTRFEVALLVVLFFAALIRMVHPALWELQSDEIWMQDDAVRLARHGQWTWIGNPTSMNSWLFHSPVSVYISAIPYLFTPNVATSRLLYGLFGTVTVAAVYLLVQRYFGKTAALVASLMVAVNPQAIEWSRYVYHPGLAPPFIIFWILTGLLGYYEGKRWAQVTHWLMLSGIIQADTVYAAMLPVSVGLVVYDWRCHPGSYRVRAKTLLLALGLATLTAVPWIIGLVGVHEGWIKPTRFHDMGYSVTQLTLPSLKTVAETVSMTVGTTNHVETLVLTDHRASWWPDERLDYLLSIQTVIIVLGGLYFIWRGLRSRLREFPGLFVAITLFWPFIFLFYSSKFIPQFYLMPAVYASALIFGIIFSKLWNWRRIAAVVLVVFIAAQLWLATGLMDRHQRSDQILSVAKLQSLLKIWDRTGREIVILDEPSEETMGNRLQWLEIWRIFSEQYPIRVVTNPQTLPLHPTGVTLVSAASGETIPTLFGEGKTANTARREFRWLAVSPKDYPVPTYHPTAQEQFGGLARINGIYAGEPPQVGQVWPLAIIWQPLQSVDSFYQFSVRLVDETGNTHGQIDGPSLEPALWRTGDIVLTRFDLPVSETLPATADLHIELVLYSWPEISSVPIVDEAGNPAGPMMKLDSSCSCGGKKPWYAK